MLPYWGAWPTGCSIHVALYVWKHLLLLGLTRERHPGNWLIEKTFSNKMNDSLRMLSKPVMLKEVWPASILHHEQTKFSALGLPPGTPAFSLSLGCFLCLGCSFFPWLCAFRTLPISTASSSIKSPFPYSSRPRESHLSLNYIIISQLSWHFTFCLTLRFFMLPFPLSRKPSEGRLYFWFLVAFPISCGSGLCTLRSDHMFNKRLLHTKFISGICSTLRKFFWTAR